MNAGKGKLTVFLGVAARAGKTQAMLHSALEAVLSRIDVVVGWIDIHGDRDMALLLQSLEVIPQSLVSGNGLALHEMDLDAILNRKPDLVIIDNLEHVNASGARHSRRFMDIEELLDAGISVHTAINVQNIESMSDIADRITGAKTENKVPDSFFGRADMIQVVDAPAEVLIRRIVKGPRDCGGVAEQVVCGPYSVNAFNMLRKMALRFAARHADSVFRSGNAGSGDREVYCSTERVLACIGPSPFGPQVLRAARRLSDNLRCDLVALYVEVSRSKLGNRDSDLLENNIHLAEELGAEVILESGTDIAAVILKVAAERHATQLVVGKPLGPHWKEMFRKSIVDRIIYRDRDVELHIIPGSRKELREHNFNPGGLFTRRLVAQYLIVLAMIAAITLVCKSAGGILDRTDVAMLFLLPVLYAGAFVGVVPSVAAAVVSVLVFDVLFVPPLYHITVSDINYLISFAVFLLVAISTGFLASRLRGQILESSSAETRAKTLYNLSRELTVVPTIEDFSRVLVGQVNKLFNIGTLLYLLDNDANLVLSSSSINEEEQAILKSESTTASWVFDHGQIAGARTDTLSEARVTYFPLKTENGVIGVIGFVDEKISAVSHLKQHETFQAIAGLATLALNKLYLSLAKQQVQSMEASERLWNALFDSVSHDLRTPLSSITGAVTTLKDQRTDLTAEQRSSLLKNIEKGSAQMNRLVGKLLDMTRVESGSLHIEEEWCDIQDIVGVALSDFSEDLEERKINISLPSDLPLIKVDFNLIVQTQINLIDNAIKYSPENSEIDVSWSLDSAEILAAVGDRGPGINNGDRQKVFDKFSRLNADNAVQGTGLGLSICKGIVEAHGGRIWLEDRPGGGCLFMFSLDVDRLYPEMMDEVERS
ncbi:MAG: sensor histidine kinase KdpD [Actinobacteria bacterium]|nr:sensor histidine kinase KdpD [Actinomycetota bacterium]